MVLSFIHLTGQLHITWICVVSFQRNLNEFVVTVSVFSNVQTETENVTVRPQRLVNSYFLPCYINTLCMCVCMYVLCMRAVLFSCEYIV